MSQAAIAMVRVSGDEQDEEAQIADCETAAAREGFEVVRLIRLHAVSGYKGVPRHLAALADSLEAVRRGEARAVVIAHSSRAGRLPARDMLRWAWDVDDAGGRVISHDEAMFGGDDIGSEIVSFMAVSGNRKKSRDISDAVTRMNRKLDAENRWRGQAPAGYEIAGQKRGKYLLEAAEPYTVGSRRVPSAAEVRQAFADAEATSTTALARRLHMTPAGVSRILRDEFYATGRSLIAHVCPPDCRQAKSDPKRLAHGHGHYAYKLGGDPLVTVTVQRAAIAGIEKRRTGDNVSSRALAKEDFSGSVKCAEGHPLYRHYSVTSGVRTRRYRCGTCRVSVRADQADELVNATALTLVKPIVARVWHGAQDTREDRKASTRHELDNPPAGLSRADRRTWEDALYDRLEAIEAEAEPSRWHEDLVTGETIAQMWAEADYAGRVELLRTRVGICMRAASDRSGNVELVEVTQSRLDIRHED